MMPWDWPELPEYAVAYVDGVEYRVVEMRQRIDGSAAPPYIGLVGPRPPSVPLLTTERYGVPIWWVSHLRAEIDGPVLDPERPHPSSRRVWSRRGRG
jgi:hypothetical protein